MAGRKKHMPFNQSKMELNWFLQKNPAVVRAFKRMKVQITPKGQLVRVFKGGCPFGPGCKIDVPDQFGDVIQNRKR